ncbi:MAG: DEAD/DEAH box helicase [Dehalococcoidia bacterium]
MQGFLELNLNSRVLRAVEAMGFEEPTPVQQEVIPRLLAGKDVIIQAQTGSGKTAAYGIPIIESIDPAQRQVQALVLAPTRELALQVSVHLSNLSKFQELSVVAVYGGQSYTHQIRAIRNGAQVVVATPGRLLDLLNRRVLSLDGVRLVVLDEADEMLDMGFLEDVERILSQVPQERQTALFSATMSQEILRLSRSYLREPDHVILSQPRSITVPTVEQSHYLVARPFKIEALIRLLDTTSPQLALVFCATKQMVSDLAWELQGTGYRAEALHGGMTQVQRENVMKASRGGRVEVLVATDVAARGLDIPEVTHVFNFDIPQDADSYVHRIGRTARAGRAGEAITLIVPREVSLLRAIERATGANIKRKELLTVAELEERERENLAAKVEEALLEGEWDGFRPLVESMAKRHDPLDLAAAALSRAFGPVKQREEIPQVTATQDSRPRKSGRPTRRPTPRPPGRGYRGRRKGKGF